ncbi:MAG TPA: hypothetical protein VNC50_22985 [Planctomycetia bacterium]|nr:hypothetical protein [Planctomycetia bacterium]
MSPLVPRLENTCVNESRPRRRSSGRGELASETAKAGAGEPAPDQSARLKPRFGVLIECPDEARQLDLLAQLLGEGWRCRALVS